jgi:hypothetical protein
VNEALVHEQVCQYLRLQYPEVMFRTDLGGIRLTIGQAAKVKRLQAGRAFPDLFVAEPCGGFHGLFIELKREGVRVRKADGTLMANEHIREQNAVIEELTKRGYYATFASGFEQAKAVLDHYLSTKA